MPNESTHNDPGLESQTGRVSLQILATLVGGVLLLCSLVSQLVYGHPFYADILAMIAAVLLGAPLVYIALDDLVRGRTNMNELVALAVLGAFASGAYLEAGAIAFFMIISVLIENRTALGAQASIESLIKLTPTRAHRVADGQEQEVDASELRPGETIRVRPGDNIPADGVVATGSSTVNQANITGESLPAEKAVGDEVYAGTINLTGVMEIRVTKAGRDATLGQVKDLILQAEQTRIPVMRMIDQYAGWYTPTVLMLVAIVLMFTLKSGAEDPWQRAIAMLVIACPAALVLATPTAMVAGLSSAARLGVLVKSVVDLEAARNLTAIVLDKTGTLTTGQLEVTRLAPMQGVEGVELLRATAAVEKNSKHPTARAITALAEKARLALPEAESFEEVSGRGVRAVVDGARVFVGRADWVVQEAADEKADGLGEQIDQALAGPETEGQSLLFVVRGGRLLGWVGLADNTRPEAAAAVDRLRDLGIKRLIIVTGDRESVAKRIAGQMHTDYKAQVLPHEKLQIVDRLKEQGHRVAVVGDGVNDAPALAAGDISIAMGAAGSDVAIHSANIALMNNKLNRIPFLIHLSRRTSAVVKQNLALGGGFIAVFMALSAANYVTPIAAAAMNVAVGLVVVFNSARLVRIGEDLEHTEADDGRPTALPPAGDRTPALSAGLPGPIVAGAT